MDIDPIDLRYYPDPGPPEVEPGVTKGYVVIWSGKPGDALIADAALLVGDDGERVIDWRGDFKPTRVVDDTP